MAEYISRAPKGGVRGSQPGIPDNIHDLLKDKADKVDVTSLTKQIADKATKQELTQVSSKVDVIAKSGTTKKDFFHLPKTGIVAHRGAHLNAPENTLKSIHNAGQLGYEMVELDLQRTSDGVWVLMHDGNVERTTDGTGTIGEKTLAQVKQLLVDENYLGKTSEEILRVPTFEEACKECQKWGIGINIDGSKMTWTEQYMNEVIDILKRYNLLDRSFFVAHGALMTMLSNRPDVMYTWLSAEPNPTANINYCKQHPNAFVTYSTSVITDSLINAYKAENIPVFVHSANTIENLYKYYSKGVRFVETDTILPGGVV